MVQSSATDVDTYVGEVPADRRAAIERLRAMCREHLPHHEERMEYGMPGYARDGVLEIGFASQKQYISLYVLNKPVLDGYRDRLPQGVGKGCVRFRSPASVDWDVVRALLVDTSASGDPVP